MNWFTGFVLYVLIWWTALFAVLPIGTKPVAEPDKVTGWRGAPSSPQIGRKVIWTTIVAAVLWLICYGVISAGWISFRTGYFALPPA